MHDISFDDVCEGMRVCDQSGNQVGTIKKLHQAGRAVGGPEAGAQGYIQVDVSLPNLPKDLYIPLNDLSHCSQDTCTLNVDKNQLNTRGYDQKPTNI